MIENENDNTEWELFQGDLTLPLFNYEYQIFNNVLNRWENKESELPFLEHRFYRRRKMTPMIERLQNQCYEEEPGVWTVVKGDRSEQLPGKHYQVLLRSGKFADRDILHQNKPLYDTTTYYRYRDIPFEGITGPGIYINKSNNEIYIICRLNEKVWLGSNSDGYTPEEFKALKELFTPERLMEVCTKGKQ